MKLLLAILTLSCAQLGSQIFFPALPQIAAQFAMTNSQTQQVIMLYFIGFGISQLVYGPWSDHVGRRRVFLIGQALFVVGSILAGLASSPFILACGRVLQGLGAGAPLIVSRTILSDSMRGTMLNQAMASLAVAASLISVLIPFIGGLITTVADWRWLFFVAALYLFAMWWIGFRFLPLGKAAPRTLSPRTILTGYSGLFFDPRFVTSASFKWLPTLLFLTSQTFFPFEFQQKLHLSAQQYGFYMMMPACGLILGTILAKKIQKHMSCEAILALFWPLLVLSGLGLVALPLSLFNSLATYSLFMICAGAYYPCSLQLLIAPFRHKAGTVNALAGAVDMFVFSALAIVANKYWVSDTQSLGVLYIIVALLLSCSWLVMLLKKNNIEKSCETSKSELHTCTQGGSQV